MELASLIVGATDVLYFANDGGIYRALDGIHWPGNKQLRE